jgi:hypothetical protein
MYNSNLPSSPQTLKSKQELSEPTVLEMWKRLKHPYNHPIKKKQLQSVRKALRHFICPCFSLPQLSSLKTLWPILSPWNLGPGSERSRQYQQISMSVSNCLNHQHKALPLFCLTQHPLSVDKQWTLLENTSRHLNKLQPAEPKDEC